MFHRERVEHSWLGIGTLCDVPRNVPRLLAMYAQSEARSRAVLPIEMFHVKQSTSARPIQASVRLKRSFKLRVTQAVCKCRHYTNAWTMQAQALHKRKLYAIGGAGVGIGLAWKFLYHPLAKQKLLQLGYH